ncbi:MAG: hypothetical protein ACYTDV_02055, partial [Planctomycetota bacterium]
GSVRGQAQDGRPVADAGSARYAADDPVVLDGTRSYDPDNSGTLSYAWEQIDGPPVIIIDASTPTPTIAGSMALTPGRDPKPKPAGFVQTDEIQECEFELVVTDGESASLPDSVKVVIVPDSGANELMLESDSFDPDKPTCTYFGGGDCVMGSGRLGYVSWIERANILSFIRYEPDPDHTPYTFELPTYYRCGDMIVVYLSSVAPNYRQPIQTLGWSTGGQPAIDVGIHLNLAYADARYAVNRVTLLDARACRDYSGSIPQFLDSSVDGEQCWIDNYRGGTDGPFPSWPSFYPNVLRVGSSLSHGGVLRWYADSLTDSDMNEFNHGIVGGAYWSVLGPGRNLQLASTPAVETYSFKWLGSESSGYMDFYDESNHPGRLPEPVTLVGPLNDAVVDANGAIFSCEESDNAVGYQLLFGSNPNRVLDYLIISDTPYPPVGTINEFPFEQTWWTIKAYDTFGSTIHADPRCINAEVVSPPPTFPHVLYIHKNDIEAAEGFRSLLTRYGCATTLIALSEAVTVASDSHDLIIVGNDTGLSNSWGDADSVAAIEASGKPVLGIGEGGYAFFGQLGLSIGWPNGGHGDRNSISVIDSNSPLFKMPHVIDVPEDLLLRLYTETDHVGLYLWPVPETVTALGGEVDNPGYYPLALEHDRYLFWGFSASAENMTEVGKALFINVVVRAANAAWAAKAN